MTELAFIRKGKPLLLRAYVALGRTQKDNNGFFLMGNRLFSENGKMGKEKRKKEEEKWSEKK